MVYYKDLFSLIEHSNLYIYKKFVRSGGILMSKKPEKKEEKKVEKKAEKKKK